MFPTWEVELVRSMYSSSSRVTNVEASIQAAFVDFGLGRNGFLHISDLMPTYFGRKGEEIVETVGKKMARRDRPPIQRCLRRGDELIVQIIKEGIGTKGPTLSSYLSIPGRYLVMMPGVGKMGVSQKIEDEVERRRLRQILDGCKPPKDVGFIIRTAGVGKSKLEIERDLKYLTRLWETLEKKRKESRGPAELYAEGDLVTRTVRDFFSADVDRIVIDNPDVAERVKEVIKISTPRSKNKVELYEETVPLFHKYGIEREIEMMYSRHVPLPGGGSLVIDSTEAIVAIDVNSGKFREHNDAEMTAFKTDMEAADEIPRQLKLRDLGGVIICDFIDLRYERNRRELEKRLHDNFKKDRAKTKVLRMSQFGIIEMTRQRMRASLKRSIYFDCPHCKGAGLVKTPESMSLDLLRRIAIAINDAKVVRVELGVCPDVAYYLQNKKRRAITELEDQTKKRVIIRADQTLGLDEMKLELFDSRDGLVVLSELDAVLSQPAHKTQLNTKPHGAQPSRSGVAAGGRPDGRQRDQGRRGPQPQQARRPGGQGGRDEDESRMDDRLELDDTEIEAPEESAAPPRDDRAGQEEPQDRPERQGQGGDDRQGRDGQQGRGGRPQQGGRPEQGGRQGRGNRPDRGAPQGPRDQANRGGRDNAGAGRGGAGGRNDRGGRPPQRQGVDGPARPPFANDNIDAPVEDREPNGNRGPGGPDEHLQGPVEGEPGDGTRRRRRRRRGRRGRGRGNNQEGQPVLQGQGPGNESSGNEGPGDENRSNEDRGQRDDHFEGGEIFAGPEREHDQADRHEDHYGHSEPLGEAPGEITDEINDDASGSHDVEEAAAGANSGGENSNERAETSSFDGDATPGAAAIAEESAAAEPKSSRRRAAPAKSRPAAKPRMPKPAAAREAVAKDDKPKRGRGGAPKAKAGPRKKETVPRADAPTSSAANPTPRPPRKPVSTDRHLMRDEPIIPDPPRRPRTSRDLDEIPDDLD